MDVAVDGFRVELARAAVHIDRPADDVQIEPALDATDIDGGGCGLYPKPHPRRHPYLESRRLRIALVRRLDEHLDARITTAHLQLITGSKRGTHQDGVLCPAMHDHAANHVRDADSAFHSKCLSTLDLCLSAEHRGQSQKRDERHPRRATRERA